MGSLSPSQLAALREVLGEGGRSSVEVESLVQELQRQPQGALPVSHDLAEARSLAIHRLIADRIRQDPGLTETARRHVETWMSEGKMHPVYGSAWKKLLLGPVELLLSVLVDPGESARALRQCTPFVGVIDQATRLRIWREVRERLAS